MILEKKSIGACIGSIKNGWYDEITHHMEKVGSKFKRLIYSFEFPDNSVYIGLTFNHKTRYDSHMRKGTVYKHIQKTGLTPKYKLLTDYLDVNDASEKETEFLNIYKNNNWIILNKNKTGGLGGKELIRTLEKCKIEAEKYNNRTEFQQNSKSTFDASQRNNWMEYVYSKLSSDWTYESCKEEALKYKIKTDFITNSKGAYMKAWRNNRLNDICQHMDILRNKKNKLK